MALTNFPQGLSSFGIPVIGCGALPPFGGKYLFVDYVNGSDSQDGAPETPLKTLEYAYTLTRSGKNDVIFIVGDGGSTGTQRLTKTLVWANDATHLIGLTAPTFYASRARISHLTTATANINPLVQVTGDGCIFANFSLFQGTGQAATAEQLWTDEGNRNLYSRVHFGGMGVNSGTTSAANASSYCLYLNGGGERVFQQCAIGLDTAVRSAANASVKFGGAAARDMFLDCDFTMYATATSPFFVVAGSGAIDRWAKFKRCNFINTMGLTSGASLDAICSPHASQGGYLIFDACTAYGADDWAPADAANVLIANSPATSGDTGGFAVTADAT
jgi:hypothetical protein